MEQRHVKKYIVNGTVYGSIEEVPAEFRALLGGASGAVTRQVKYNVDGKEYNSLEEMPEDVRRLFDDKNNNGIPDIAEGPHGKNVASPDLREQSRIITDSSIRQDGPGHLFLPVLAIAVVALAAYFLLFR